MEEIRKQTSGDLAPVAVISYIEAMAISTLHFVNESQKESVINKTIRVNIQCFPLTHTQHMFPVFYYGSICNSFVHFNPLQS